MRYEYQDIPTYTDTYNPLPPPEAMKPSKKTSKPQLLLQKALNKAILAMALTTIALLAATASLAAWKLLAYVAGL